ncbi:FGGY-family carbohydrate kinase [Roseibium salinum]|uniref:Carbohydrate kinase n=1 Tax=Roseibium salinum TaxID=1604349 RepID=A0ABT3QX36_9HYPH|nr:FGGY-family carbohydrate kinase [Roseibium sp. DSM 29163]MCX2721403.1 carbohydrate kinase [Roseibium sp. DSM 29163]
MADGMTYLLGLDAGNTVIKAVLFDLEGRQVAMHALDGQSSTPRPGCVERDLSELWENAKLAIRRCVEEAAIDPSRIAAIGCAGHGNGLYLLDREDAPLIGIQSLDTRAAALAEELKEANGEAFYRLCRQEPWPSQTPVLLAWIKRHRPDLYERAGTVLLCKDFITFKLTGERVSEISDMSGCGFTRMPECVYDDDLLSLYGLGDAKGLLPRLIHPSNIAGHVSAEAAALTGLVQGTPVIGGYFDVIASALGSGVVRSGEASIIAGTWSINQVFSTEPVNNRKVFMASGFAPGRFVNIESSATSAANLEWYVRELVERGSHHDDPFGYCNVRIAEITPAADDPFFHPFLYGSGQGAGFRAGFYGLAGWHSEGHLLRALFEGVLFEHRRHIDVLMNSGVSFEHAVLAGGGSRSPVWPQMFADCLGVPIRVAEARETGALGAAIGAAVGAGLFAVYEDGVTAMTRARHEYLPDASMKEHYDRRYRTYLKLADAMKSFWAETNEAASSQSG